MADRHYIIMMTTKLQSNICFGGDIW